MVLGIELIHSAVGRILRPQQYVASWWIIGLVAATIPAKEWLAIFSRRISAATGSSSLEVDYWFHRFDSITSASVCLGLLLSRYGWASVDGWIALVIAMVIVWTAFTLVKSTISPLLGEAPTQEKWRRCIGRRWRWKACTAFTTSSSTSTAT